MNDPLSPLRSGRTCAWLCPLFPLAAFACCLLLAACGDTIYGKALAEKQMDVFHDQLNAGKFNEIYASAAQEFRDAAPKEKVLRLFAAVKGKLGSVQTATTTGWRVNTINLTTVVILTEDVHFEHGTATETFTYKVSGEHATLAGYNINSMDLIEM
jgi:hypothetical protein